MTLSGKVLALDTGNPISGVLVRVLLLNPTDNTTTFLKNAGSDVSATSAADGSFAFTQAVSLAVDSYQHYLHISDPAGNYFDSDSTVIYAMRDSVLKYDAIKLSAKAPASYSTISGTIKDLLAGSAVSGLTVTLTNTNTAVTYTGTSGATGSFSIDKVPVAFYKMELDGSTLTTPYNKESSDLILENTATNALGDLLVSQASTGDDLRIVLSWTNRDLDLDGSFSLPLENFDFNHLGTKQVRLPSSIITVNPAFKFAEGTAYWPENMGGAADVGNRVLVNKGKLSHSVSGTKIVELDKDSLDGATPEVTTIYKQNPQTGYPGKLAYFYDFTKEGTAQTYFPMGMGIYNVTCSTPNASIYDSGATVKVYQGSTYLGKFSVADLTIDQGESNRRYWAVLQVEIGYTKASPQASTDIYYRVVPYSSAGALPDSRFPGYFYQETHLPGDETFSVFLDKKVYSRDYDLVPPPYAERVIASKSGKIYSYDWNNGLSWKKKLLAPISSRAYTAGFYWGTGAQDLFLAQSSTADQSPLAKAKSTLDSVTFLDGIDSVMTDTVSTNGVNVYDSALVRFMADQTFLLLATDKGPRGASTINLEYSPNLSGLQNGFSDTTPGGVLTPGTSRQLTTTIPVRNQYGSIGKFALIGGQGLFLFNAAYALCDTVPATPSWTTKATFSEVHQTADIGTLRPEINLSLPGVIVTSMVQFPPLTSSYSFIVAVREGVFSTPKLYEVMYNASGGTGPRFIFPLPDPGFAINDLLFVNIDRGWVLLAATDTGIKLNKAWSSTVSPWVDYLPDMLGGFKVNKLVDYDGKLGILSEDNGLMYGPYPQ